MDINTLYKSHSEHIFFVCQRIIGNSAMAEEAMQEAFVKYHLYEQKDTIQNAEAWLVKAAARISLDMVRKENRDRKLIEEYEPVAKEEAGASLCVPADSSPAALRITLIKRALAMLPRAQRSVVSLRLIEGLDYDEIEQVTGVGQKSLRSNFMRGKERLAELVKEMEKGLNK